MELGRLKMLTELPSELLNLIIDQASISEPFFDMMSALMFYKFPDDQLRTFRWELGTCVPEDMLWGGQSPLRNQRQIESVTLVTDGGCGASIFTQYFVDLARLEGLRSLEWRGLQRYDDFESIAKCIAVRGHQIESLSLDLVFWNRAEMIWIDVFSERIQQRTRVPDNFFAHTVLGIQPGVHKQSLPHLKFLALSSVSFHHAGMEMLDAFNVERLQSLKLCNCPGTLDWLQLVIASEMVMNLKSFELVFNSGTSDLRLDSVERLSETVGGFIRRLRGLENLFIMLSCPVDWNTVADAISTHDSSLKRVVTHCLDDIGGCDFNDSDVPWNLQFDHVLDGRCLEGFGTSMLPRELLGHFRRMSTRPVCKLLHLRTSGIVLDGLVGFEEEAPASDVFGTTVLGRRPFQTSEDEYNFAEWAFSTDGLPNLQILALGDFSFEGRYSKYNVLLCRSDSGYQILTRLNTQSWDLVQNNTDMLAACPFDAIMI
ncbi:hypothetical protein I7I51_01993 [Histoplasma capsulatum]|uniref:Uncharacterized protein n=1 Tax=Ajellomyces capsulatus TaxID=5037 RepID=A0A8A1ME79_AJECA|nr:hypothetical protein I7I51_01993 [Histoplasma capsulatum]